MGQHALRIAERIAPHEPALDDFALAAIGVRDVVLGGTRSIEAYALDRDGVRHRLALHPVHRNASAARAAVFASLLVRGLRARAPILVDADGCAVLRLRVLAAWGSYAVFVASR